MDPDLCTLLRRDDPQKENRVLEMGFYYNRLAVQVECRVWDERRDLALAKIIRIKTSEEHSSPVRPVFTFVPVAESLSNSAHIHCIGQPGTDDLESGVSHKTACGLIETSRGRLLHDIWCRPTGQLRYRHSGI